MALTIEKYIFDSIKHGKQWLSHIVSESSFNKEYTTNKVREMVMEKRLQIIDQVTVTDFTGKPLTTTSGQKYKDFKLQITQQSNDT